MTDRYSRQTILPQIGKAGQARLANANITIVGMGALGTHMAELLVRAGVVKLRIIDRDYVEESNLQRQALYGIMDVGEKKVEAAENSLRMINPDVRVAMIHRDVTPENIRGLLQGTDLVLDGTDNLLTRFLINETCDWYGIPWAYTACEGMTGQGFFIRPGKTACFHCLFPNAVPSLEGGGCDVVGIFGPVVSTVTAYTVMQVTKYLLDDNVDEYLYNFNLWSGASFKLDVGKDLDCPVCVQKKYDYLDGQAWYNSDERLLCRPKSAREVTGFAHKYPIRTQSLKDG